MNKSGLVFLVLLVVLFSVPEAIAADGKVLELNSPDTNSYAQVKHSSGTSVVGALPYSVQWEATVRDNPAGNVYIMQLYVTDGNGGSTLITPSFRWNADSKTLYACYGSTCTDVTDYGDITNEWLKFKIQLSAPFSEPGDQYTLTVKWYINDNEVFSTSVTSTNEPYLEYTIAGTSAGTQFKLFLDNVQEGSSSTTSEDFDDGSDDYFTVHSTSGDATIGVVDISQVPFFGNILLGIVALVFMVLVFKKI